MSKGRCKEKVFRCPVHGYVKIPADVCSSFIDTPIFQRLKYIEQTSMRPLYPSAHHNRFVHSVGVYHLACVAIEHLKENTLKERKNESYEGELNSLFEKYTTAFELAALMHDCAHSPFSHTFENSLDIQWAEKSLKTFDAGTDFNEEFTILMHPDTRPKHHEIFSSAILLEHYVTSIKEFVPNVNPQVLVRMITGCKYRIGDINIEK